MTGHRTRPTVLQRKWACGKQPQPDLDAPHRDRKSLVPESVMPQQYKLGTQQDNT